MPRLRDPRFAPDCTIEVDGRPVAARAGESVAVALLAAGELLLARSAKYHRPRGAFCLAGSCHSCLARVDGVPNQRTCRVACRPGIIVETQNAVPSAERDLLGVVDHLFARGLDHHHLATWNRLANRAAVALSRRLAGTGRLPAAAMAVASPAPAASFDAVVVGAGPAGLGAAEALARGRVRLLLVEGDDAVGGRLRCGLHVEGDAAPSWAGEVTRLVAAAGGEVATGLVAFGLWHDDGRPLLALRREEPAAPARVVRARTVLLATGAVAVPPACARNDLPGVLAGRGVARVLAEDGVLPARRCLVAGPGPERELVAARLRAAGAAVVESAGISAVHGGRRVAGAALPTGERIRCGALAWCGPRAPAAELARQAGARVEVGADGEARLDADGTGAVGVPGVRVAGELVGPLGVRDAVASGRRAGEAARGD
jgi:sarcosine oxidase subunit alpha